MIFRSVLNHYKDSLVINLHIRKALALVFWKTAAEHLDKIGLAADDLLI